MVQNRREFLRTATGGIPPLLGCSCLGCIPAVIRHSDGQHGIPVVATTGMIADLVRRLAKDAVQLTQLIAAGVDPHLYKPIRDDIVAIVNSRVVFYNGLKLEGRMADVLGNRSDNGRVHVPLSDALDPNILLGEPGNDAPDPHIWMDVSQWSQTVPLIAKTLIAVLPHLESEINQSAQQLRLDLDQLDEQGRLAIATIPPKQRVLISSHDAFQYFGRRYGLEVEGVQGISTASEAGLQRIPQLINKVIENGIPAVFKESSVAGKMIDAVIEGASARGIRLQVGPELYSDALGPKGSGADTYLGMMKHNFQAVTTALGGNWPH